MFFFLFGRGRGKNSPHKSSREVFKNDIVCVFNNKKQKKKKIKFRILKEILSFLHHVVNEIKEYIRYENI